MSWSKWKKIDEKSGYDGFVVYKIRLYDKKCKQPITLRRFFGMDRKGILAIGRTKNIERRRKQFYKGINDGAGHSEGNLLRQSYSPCFESKYPNTNYEFQYSFKRDGRKKKTEEIEIKKYFKKHGEVPPLNSAIPNRYGS